MPYDAGMSSGLFKSEAGNTGPGALVLKVDPPAPFVKSSSSMTFPPERPKAHSALNVYFPTGESLLMNMTPLVESKPSLDAKGNGAYASTDLNLSGAAI